MYAAFLSEKNDVTLFDINKEQIQAINNQGIVIEANGEKTTYKNIHAACNGTDIGFADLVIVFVKGMYTLDVMSANKRIIGPDTLVMTLQNGAGNDRDIMQFVPAEKVIVGTSKHNSVNLGHGHIFHSGPGATTIGSNAGAAENVHVIAEMFNECGIETIESDDIQRIIWSKLFVNLSINSFTALMGVPIGYMYENSYAWDFARRIISEAVQVAEADGTSFDCDEVLEMVRGICITMKDGYASMYQDRKNKVKTEIDRINGAIVEQAKLYGVPTPYNAMMVDLIHAMEGTYEFQK